MPHCAPARDPPREQFVLPVLQGHGPSMSKPRLEPDEALAGPLYLVAGLLFFMPLLDFAMSIGPAQFASVQWRFASVGLLSGYTLMPLLGLAMALGLAGLLRQRVAQRVLIVFCLTLAVVIVLISVVFLLDVVQLRATVPADGRPAFQSASMRALAKHLLGGFAFWYLGWRARRMVPPPIRAKAPRTVQIVNK